MNEASSTHKQMVTLAVTGERMEVYVEGRLLLRECVAGSENGALAPQLYGGESMTNIINGRPWIVRMRPRLTARGG